MKTLKPYYKRGNKLFFRKGKKKMTVLRESIGCYQFRGDVIEGELFIGDFKELNDSVLQIATYR